jgi:hypothetical protein
VLPVMNREPEALPDIPGGGWSYQQFLEYLDLGIVPYDDGTFDEFWSGLGAYEWSILVDGVPSGVTFRGFDGTSGPYRILVGGGGAIDWTVPHTWQLSATYFDRPAYSEFWFDPASIGIVAFGPGTMTIDPNVPYIRAGYFFGCCERHNTFFPSIFWGDAGVLEEAWVTSHRAVGDPLGPLDRHGNYLGLSGPWGSAVPQQYFASGPNETPCSCLNCAICGEPGSLDSSGSVGSGDVYATSLLDLAEITTYARHEYTVTSSTQTLPACSPVTSNPVFDVTRSHKAHH